MLEASTLPPSKLSCGVPKGPILNPLLFLLYVNDMPEALNYELLLLYADDTCRGGGTKATEDQPNTDFILSVNGSSITKYTCAFPIF